MPRRELPAIGAPHPEWAEQLNYAVEGVQDDIAAAGDIPAAVVQATTAAAAAEAARVAALAAAAAAHDLSMISTSDGVMTAVAKDSTSSFAVQQSASYATRGELRSQAKADGTDQTALIQAELNALHAFGGGRLLLCGGGIVVEGQLVMPAGAVTTTGARRQNTLAIIGVGGFHSGQQGAPVSGATRLILNHQSATYNDAKIVTYGLGRLSFRGITFSWSDIDDETPILMTTNTTVFIDEHAVVGPGHFAACKMDFFVGGGTRKPLDTGYGHPDSAFQGYGSLIGPGYYSGVRRMVHGRSYFNHVQIYPGFMEKDCGSNLPLGGAIDINGGLDTANTHPGDYCTGNTIHPGYMNGLGYVHQIKITQGTRNVGLGVGSPDPQDDLVSLVGFYAGPDVAGVQYPSYENQLYGNHCQQTVHMFEDAKSLHRNQLIGGTFPEGNILDKTTFLNGVVIPVTTAAAHTVVDFTGDVVQAIGGAARTLAHRGALSILGKPGVPGSTKIQIGDNGATNDDDAVLDLKPAEGKSSTVQWAKWTQYDASSILLFLRDRVNGRMHVTYTPGATAAAADSDFNSNVTVQGVIRAKSPNGTLMQLIPPNGGGAATWQSV